MNKGVLVVVDVQNDFVNGALGTAETEKMLPRLVEKVKSYSGIVVYTLDTHQKNYLQTQEGRLLPVEHCIEGTQGWQLVAQLQEPLKNCKVYKKPTFGSKLLAEDMLRLYNQGKIDEIELVGLCTDICVISNALLLKAYMPELKISVDAGCCAGVTVQKHRAALEVMKSCQIIVND